MAGPVRAAFPAPVSMQETLLFFCKKNVLAWCSGQRLSSKNKRKLEPKMGFW